MLYCIARILPNRWPWLSQGIDGVLQAGQVRLPALQLPQLWPEQLQPHWLQHWPQSLADVMTSTLPLQESLSELQYCGCRSMIAISH